MYRLYVILCLCSFAIAAVLPVENNAVILSYDYENSGQGNYKFSYKTSNGIERNETGELVNIGQENEHIAVRGFYSYVDPDDKSVHIDYTADEKGYHVILRVGGEVSTTTREEPERISFSAPGVSPQVLASLLGK